MQDGAAVGEGRHDADMRRAFALVLGTGVIWGTIGVAAKAVFETTTLDAVSLNWLRTLVASATCLAIAGPTLRAGLERASRRDLGLMVLLGVIIVFYQWSYLAAVDRIGVATATLISLCVPPALVALLSALFLGEALSRTGVVALAGALVGTGLLVGSPPVAAEGGVFLAGVLFALGSAAGIAAHALGSRRIAGRHDALLPLAVAFPAGAVAFAPIALSRGLSFDQPLTGWLLVIYLGVVPSALAYVMFQRGLRYLPASTASILTLAEPLTAAVLAWVLFSEALSPVGIAGGALLLASIVLLTRRPPGGRPG
ncbi:MAG: EamA family transporter [Thermomicrobiales bacterium]